MTNTYVKTAERLWEKLESHRSELNTECVDLSNPFPIDQLLDENPEVGEWIQEIQEEFNYNMSDFQCSWAVFMLLKGDMEDYNNKHNKNLQPKS